MKRKNKVLLLILISVLTAALLFGCANDESDDFPQDVTDAESAPTVEEDQDQEIEYDADETEAEDDAEENVTEDVANEADAAKDNANEPETGSNAKEAATENNENKPETDNKKGDVLVIPINITSESLTSDGKWLTVIKSSKGNPPGANLSPQLSWDEVEGAGCYAIYMIDNTARNWLHWLAKNVKENNLPMGASLNDSKYEGPYPPSGTHEYEVIVYALKKTPDKYPGKCDNVNSSISSIEEKLDIASGESGNIIGKGSIKGTVTFGETVE